MKKIPRKIIIITFFISLALVSEFLKRQALAADYFVRQVTGKIILETTNHGRAWYIFPADTRRYYLGKPKDAFLLAKNLALEISATQIQKITLNQNFLNQNTLDSDHDGLSNALEGWLGTNSHNSDSDQDGYPDNIEIKNGYNPSGPGKLVRDKNIVQQLAGNFLYNKDLTGLWYINPANLQAYFIENEASMLRLMQKASLSMDSVSLQRIEGLIIGPQYMSEEIKKNETVIEPKSNTLRYTDSAHLYSLSFPQEWAIKKYPDAPQMVNITDANRDFIAERKAAIIIQTINMGTSSSLENFKTPVMSGIIITQETTKTIQGKKSYGKIATFPNMRKKSLVIELGNNIFLDISLNVSRSVDSAYDKIFDTLVDSLSFD